VDPLDPRRRGQQHGQQQQKQQEPAATTTVDEITTTLPTLYSDIETKTLLLDLGTYRRDCVSNLDNTTSYNRNSDDDDDDTGRVYFDQGLRLLFSYQHEMAAQHLLASLQYAPNCALSHGLVALCHSPNYNFKGEPYYLSTNHHVGVGVGVGVGGVGGDTAGTTGGGGDENKHDLLCVFPSQQVAHRHSKAGVDKIEEIIKRHKRSTSGAKGGKNKGGKHKSNKKGNNNSNISSAQESTTVSAAAAAAGDEGLPDLISPAEVQLLQAIRILTCNPGVDPDLSEELVGRPYADALRKVHEQYGDSDPLVTYCFCEALMVLNAWQLYEYPSGKPVSPDVLECKSVLERALYTFPHHAGLCHLYVHLSEMSSCPQMALPACRPLRYEFPNAGHLIHMATHIDVLLGDYTSVVQYNENAVVADMHVATLFPRTAGPESFYFGYIVHNYHMAVYGAILGAMQKKATQMAQRLCDIVNEDMLQEFSNLAPYLESYAALDIHVLIRFGQWQALLGSDYINSNCSSSSSSSGDDETALAATTKTAIIQPPRDAQLMLFRAASLAYGKGLAYATLSSSLSLSSSSSSAQSSSSNFFSHEQRLEYLKLARKQADRLDGLRGHVDAKFRILHNNSVADLLAVDATMLRGEIAYHTASAAAAAANDNNTNDDNNKNNTNALYNAAFDLLYKAVRMQDSLNYDEPWGKMQPVRHALGGLLLEQGRLTEARIVFQDDLKFHPKNPWALVGLVSCLEKMKMMQQHEQEQHDEEDNGTSSGACCSSLQKKNNTGADATDTKEPLSVQQQQQQDEYIEEDLTATIAKLKAQLQEQQSHEWADFKVLVPCECCCKLKNNH
jgi:hypothetical protein